MFLNDSCFYGYNFKLHKNPLKQWSHGYVNIQVQSQWCAFFVVCFKYISTKNVLKNEFIKIHYTFNKLFNI